MVEFSRRYGYRPEKLIQIESMDADLRTSLWNVFYSHIGQISYEEGCDAQSVQDDIVVPLWGHHLKWPLSEMPDLWISQEVFLHKHFIEADWFCIYDMIEFITSAFRKNKYAQVRAFVGSCNQALEREQSAYRLVGSSVVPVTNEIEVQAVENMLQSPNDAVRAQILSAVQKFSMKPNPDLRNCIKESIGAVETAVRLAAGNSRGTLGKLLPQLQTKIGLHPAQVEGFKKLYGYTNDDKSGIRHGMMDKDDLTTDDARYMLVICSAFSNYLLRLAERAGVKL